MSTENPAPIAGLHHVTAITADAQANIDFYTGVLGLRLVKLTVNFDDPGSYHLYYGDELGRPGTIMTFFAWPGAYGGRIGPPQVTATAFAVPSGSLDYWAARLRDVQVDATPAEARLGQRVLSFGDPDGLQLELIESSDAGDREPWSTAAVPRLHAIRGFHGVTISGEGYENTARLLTETMGYAAEGNEGNRFRYRAGGGGGRSEGLASVVDLVCVPDARKGGMGAGAVHHVAFRTPDDAQQLTWRRTLVEQDYNVSPVMDRTYFHSIYYREPGGVLFEIATESPGFTADQSAAELGKRLMLPPWLEKHRREIEAAVPPVRLPSAP
jgi:catechol 2,3-dioxygenase-like lactoylglutathione lyase family enzyme